MAKKIQAPADLPMYNQLMWPVIESLKELGGSASTQELLAIVSKKMNISEESQSFRREEKARDELLLRSDWTKWYLKKAGVIDYQDKVWSLLPAGRALTQAQVKLIPGQVKRMSSKNGSSVEEQNVDEIEETGEDEAASSPKEDLWRGELLNTLQNMHPSGFERLTMRLLRQCGFEKVEITGRTGDQGIDGKGILRLNLISFHVIFQCKRYKDVVGPGVVRDFRGAMSGRTDKGILITTGRFSPKSKEEATREGAPSIELIDGELLCDMLKNLKLGTSTEIVQVETVRIDKDFFENI